MTNEINNGRFKKGQNLGNTNGFKKGMIPWSKGKKFPENSGKKNNLWRGGKINKPCEICKVVFEKYPSNPTKTCSKKCLNVLIKNTRSGNSSPNWKGGVTPMTRMIRASLEYKIWRKSVFERDNYTCIWCGLRSGNGKAVILHADHIKLFAYFPELRLAIDNGRTLCINCHKTTETFCGKGMKRNKK